MNEEQKYLFDVFGYIVIPNVLTMTDIERLRDTIAGPTEQFPPVPQEEGPLHWDSIWRDLLDNPVIDPLLESLIGNPELRHRRDKQNRTAKPTYRLDHINVHTHVAKGFEGGILHGGWNGVSGFYRYDNGTLFNGLTTVSFELYDTTGNDGGFACIPGSHKANIPAPRRWLDLSKGVHPSITRVCANAGDAIIFTEALTHGTLPWHVDDPRSTVFYKFSPHTLSWSADFYDQEDFVGYEDMSERKLALLEKPNARYPRRPKS